MTGLTAQAKAMRCGDNCHVPELLRQNTDLLDALREMVAAFSPDIYRIAAADFGKATEADEATAQARAAVEKAELQVPSKTGKG